MSNFTPHDDRNDPTAARLRAALNAEAAMVQPDDQLSSIRERTVTFGLSSLLGCFSHWRSTTVLTLSGFFL